MNKRIHALPLHLANQIAAGEVVERPASVLKELVENSIDAGASQIDIQIEGAGSQLIRVSDNGQGIHPDDLALALSRHATSKIQQSEQLSHIDSLGFRGEALPSIASVSRLTLISKQADQQCGWQIGSDKDQAEPAAHPDGTSVSVAELFFNLPARRRFLRSDKTELHHLITTFNRLALSRFDVGFSARFADQQFIKLPLTQPSQRAQRVAKICGNAFVRESQYIEQQFDDIRLQGWVGKATAHRAQTDVQYFFINGRVIRDRIINHAVRQAYGETIPAGRQPAYVLYLTLPLDRVDVNVHPTKHEVRFRDARLVHGLITRAVAEALEQAPEELAQDELPLAESAADKQHVAEKTADYASQSQAKPVSSLAAVSHNHNAKLALLHQRYALLTAPEPELIDLQAADKALRQQQFLQAFKTGELTSRAILVPVRIKLDDKALSLLTTHQALLSSFALEYQLGDNDVTIKRVPFLLAQVDLKQLMASVIDALQQPVPSPEVLAQGMLQLLPMTAIHSQEQAQQIIVQLDSQPSLSQTWRQKLDPATLTGLFSN